MSLSCFCRAAPALWGRAISGAALRLLTGRSAGRFCWSACRGEAGGVVPILDRVPVPRGQMMSLVHEVAADHVRVGQPCGEVEGPFREVCVGPGPLALPPLDSRHGGGGR